jgi:hypothetical protein
LIGNANPDRVSLPSYGGGNNRTTGPKTNIIKRQIVALPTGRVIGNPQGDRSIGVSVGKRKSDLLPSRLRKDLYIACGLLGQNSSICCLDLKN